MNNVATVQRNNQEKQHKTQEAQYYYSNKGTKLSALDWGSGNKNGEEITSRQIQETKITTHEKLLDIKDKKERGVIHSYREGIKKQKYLR